VGNKSRTGVPGPANKLPTCVFLAAEIEADVGELIGQRRSIMNEHTDLVPDFETLRRELPIDLAAQIEKELIAAEVLISILRAQPVSTETAGLLAETLLIRNHLQLLKSYVLATYSRVIINPSDDDYLILKAISDRLDNAILTSGLASTAPEHLHLLVDTIRKGLEIADTLTAC
jgi:hypothetical protein